MKLFVKISTFLLISILLPFSEGLSCYDNTAGVINGGFISGVLPWFTQTGYQAVEPTSEASVQVVSNCTSCLKYSAIYNTVTLRYNRVRYQCVSSAGQDYFYTSSQGGCKGSYDVVAYTDNTIITSSCSCCTDLCNKDDYCSVNDPVIQNLVATYGGFVKRDYGCGTGVSLQTSSNNYFIIITIAAIITSALIEIINC